MIRIGFTGTQQGMDNKQLADFYKLVSSRKALFEIEGWEFHHGDCIGADEQAMKIANEFFAKIVCHPPVNNQKRAYTLYDDVRAAKPYLERNKDIVNETDILWATPKERLEVLRSGTWATIRYAKKVGKPSYIIYPGRS